MKVRIILPIMVFCIVTASVFAQSNRIVGKWGTDGAATAAAKAVMLDLRVDARNNVTGSMTEYASPFCGSPNTSLPIDRGEVVGKVVTFVTTYPTVCPTAGKANASRGSGTQVMWTGTLGDDGSLSITLAATGAPAASGPQNSSGTPASPNPVQGMTTPPIQGMTTPPIQGTKTPPIQGMTTSPIQPLGGGIAAPGGGGAAAGARNAAGGRVLVMHRL